jgi:hypothetical protein
MRLAFDHQRIRLRGPGCYLGPQEPGFFKLKARDERAERRVAPDRRRKLGLGSPSSPNSASLARIDILSVSAANEMSRRFRPLSARDRFDECRLLSQGNRSAFDRFLGHSFRCRSERKRAVRVDFATSPDQMEAHGKMT